MNPRCSPQEQLDLLGLVEPQRRVLQVFELRSLACEEEMRKEVHLVGSQETWVDSGSCLEELHNGCFHCFGESLVDGEAGHGDDASDEAVRRWPHHDGPCGWVK